MPAAFPTKGNVKFAHTSPNWTYRTACVSVMHNLLVSVCIPTHTLNFFCIPTKFHKHGQ